MTQLYRTLALASLCVGVVFPARERFIHHVVSLRETLVGEIPRSFTALQSREV
jgi:hypothetical protein